MSSGDQESWLQAFQQLYPEVGSCQFGRPGVGPPPGGEIVPPLQSLSCCNLWPLDRLGFWGDRWGMVNLDMRLQECYYHSWVGPFHYQEGAARLGAVDRHVGCALIGVGPRTSSPPASCTTGEVQDAQLSIT